MVFGYARVSTMEQSLDLQLDALLKIGDDQFPNQTFQRKKILIFTSVTPPFI